MMAWKRWRGLMNRSTYNLFSVAQIQFVVWVLLLQDMRKIPILYFVLYGPSQLHANSSTSIRMPCRRVHVFLPLIGCSVKSIEVRDGCWYFHRLPHPKSIWRCMRCSHLCQCPVEFIMTRAVIWHERFVIEFIRNIAVLCRYVAHSGRYTRVK